MARGGHAMPRHGHAIVMVSKWRCWQGWALVLRGEWRCQGAVVAQVGPSPTPNFSMGNHLIPALKVFEEKPERKVFSKFEILFGGL